jgi:hypothetical protein
MKKACLSLIASALFSLVSSSVFAGTCEIKFTRTSCEGKEAISYKKCDGNKSCSEFVEAATAKDCATAAVAACENKRLDITKSKVINASFDEKKITTAAGKDDFCTDYKNAAAEFNQCK